MKKLFLIAMLFVPCITVAQLTYEQTMLVEQAIKDKWISCDCSVNKVMIKAAMWNDMPYQAKEGFGGMLAHYCAGKRKSTLYYINIHDYYSGKQIAKWSKSWGFKIY